MNTITLPLCACYCGRNVNTRKRQFLPGHDAKLKSKMQAAYRGNTGVTIPPEYNDGARSEVSPMVLAAARNWYEFLTAPPKRQQEPKVEIDTAPIEVRGFRPVRAKIGRWEYDAQVVNYPDGPDGDRLTVEYRTAQGELVTKEITRDKLVED
jgi:hypothetical protein